MAEPHVPETPAIGVGLPEVEVELPPGPLRKLERGLFWIEQILLVSFIGILVGLSFLQVVLYNLSRFEIEAAARGAMALNWSDSFLRHLVLVIGFLGASLATREGRHLSVDMVSRALPPRPRVLLKAVMDLISAVVCVLLARAAWSLMGFDADSVAFRIGTSEVPRWPFYLAIVAGFALIGVRFVIRGVEDFWHGWTGQLEPEAPPI